VSTPVVDGSSVTARQRRDRSRQHVGPRLHRQAPNPANPAATAHGPRRAIQLLAMRPTHQTRPTMGPRTRRPRPQHLARTRTPRSRVSSRRQPSHSRSQTTHHSTMGVVIFLPGPDQATAESRHTHTESEISSSLSGEGSLFWWASATRPPESNFPPDGILGADRGRFGPRWTGDPTTTPARRPAHRAPRDPSRERFGDWSRREC
jgi:hypothetical protein